jgi:pimeloyl-ACP methyl ester carboxylesterase
MPYLSRPGATLYYDVVGDGPTILTTHGLIESGVYWSRTGVSAELAAAGFRVVDMDMHAHGRSVPEEGPTSATPRIRSPRTSAHRRPTWAPSASTC